jgi:hypothetical protein
LTIIGFEVLGAKSPLGLILGTTVGCLVEGLSETGTFVGCLDVKGTTISVVGLNVDSNVIFGVGLWTSGAISVDLVVSVIIFDGSPVVSVGSLSKVDCTSGSVVASTISVTLGSSVVTVTSPVAAGVAFSFSAGVIVDTGASFISKSGVVTILDCGEDTIADDIHRSSSEYNTFKSGKVDEYVVDELSVDDRISRSIIEDWILLSTTISSCGCCVILRDGDTTSIRVDEVASIFVVISDGSNILDSEGISDELGVDGKRDIVESELVDDNSDFDSRSKLVEDRSGLVISALRTIAVALGT